MPPGVELLRPPRHREPGHEAGQDRRCLLPADHVEQLARLVDEVERVPTVEEEVIGRRGRQNVGKGGRRHAGGGRGQERALGAIGVADVDEATEPPLQAIGCKGNIARREGIEREARRLPCAVAGDVDQTVVKGERLVLRVQLREEVAHRGENRQTGRPAAAPVGRAEATPDRQDLALAGHRPRATRARS